MQYSVSPVGIVHSCFKEKFAIPRQPQLAPAARGILELLPPFNDPAAVAGLEQVSHVWLLFLFHQALEDKPRLKVRPPRLGGNASIGVFASRATHRPNGIGQSALVNTRQPNTAAGNNQDMMMGDFYRLLDDVTNQLAPLAPFDLFA